MDHICNDNDYLPAYLEYFTDYMRSNDIQSALTKHVPALLPGLAGALLHPIIHMGFGIDAQNKKIVCEALAAMCVSYVPVSIAPTPTTDINTSCTTSSIQSKELIHHNGCGILTMTNIYLHHAITTKLQDRIQHCINSSRFQTKFHTNFLRKLNCFLDDSIGIGSELASLTPLSSLYIPIDSVDTTNNPIEPMPLLLKPTQTYYQVPNSIVESIQLIVTAFITSECDFFILHGMTSLYSLIITMNSLGLHDCDKEVLQYNIPMKMNIKKESLNYWWRVVMILILSRSQNLRDTQQHMYQLLNRGGIVKSGAVSDSSNSKSSVMSDTTARTTTANATVPGVVDKNWWKQAFTSLLNHTDDQTHSIKAIYVLHNWYLMPQLPSSLRALLVHAANTQLLHVFGENSKNNMKQTDVAHQTTAVTGEKGG